MDDEGNEGDLSDPDSATTQAEPVDDSFDGTGNIKCPEGELLYATILETVFEHVGTFWTGWWPILHIVLNWEVSELSETLSIQIGFDLLGSIAVETFDLISVLGDDSFIDFLAGSWSNTLAALTGLTFSLALTAITIFEGFYRVLGFYSPWTAGALIAAIIAVGVYCFLTIVNCEYALANGKISHGEAAAFYQNCFLEVIILAIGGLEISGFISKRVFKSVSSRLEQKLGEKAKEMFLEVAEKMTFAKYFIILMAAIFFGAMMFHVLLSL